MIAPTQQSQLRGWLQEQIPDAYEVAVSALSRPSGQGVSNETWLFDADWRDHLGRHHRELVLRLHPSEFQLFMAPRFAEQFALLESLRRTGIVKVPKALWFEPDPAVLGRPFFVMERVIGRAPSSNPTYNETGWLAEATPAQRRTLWSSAVDELARIHSVPTRAVAFLEGGRDGLAAQVHSSRRSLYWSTDERPPDFLVLLDEWLENHLPAGRTTGLSWGDARIGNMLFESDFRVTAVLDWEQASLAGPQTDLGWWLLFDDLHSQAADVPRLDGLGDRAETIDLWQDLTGLKAGDVTWYEVFCSYRLLQIACRARILLGRPMRDTATEEWLVRRCCESTGLRPPPGDRVTE